MHINLQCDPWLALLHFRGMWRLKLGAPLFDLLHESKSLKNLSNLMSFWKPWTTTNKWIWMTICKERKIAFEKAHLKVTLVNTNPLKCCLDCYSLLWTQKLYSLFFLQNSTEKPQYIPILIEQALVTRSSGLERVLSQARWYPTCMRLFTARVDSTKCW